jgi:hypothetical protein
MDRQHPDFPLFKEEFWIWFDALPKQKKEMFWRHKDGGGMAETNFYFTVYSKKRLTSEENPVE